MLTQEKLRTPAKAPFLGINLPGNILAQTFDGSGDWYKSIEQALEQLFEETPEIENLE